MTWRRPTDGPLPPLRGDRIQLQQVFLNLIRNAMDAIGHDRTDGRIVIAARQRTSPLRLEFSVTDNGTGIDDLIEAGLIERLFEPLTTSKPNGLGLGLAISASIVEAHGGRIWYVPETTGGAEFRVSLPVEPSAS